MKYLITSKITTKNPYRGMSNVALTELAKGDKNGNNKDYKAVKELERRQKKHSK